MELQMEYIEFKKKDGSLTWKFLRAITDGITKGFKLGSLYSDVTNSPSEMSTEPLTA
jgi:hypothetical protein